MNTIEPTEILRAIGLVVAVLAVVIGLPAVAMLCFAWSAIKTGIEDEQEAPEPPLFESCRLRCDVCGEYWEFHFACEECSRLMSVEREEFMTVCHNCCLCHLRNSGCPTSLSVLTSESNDVPF